MQLSYSEIDSLINVISNPQSGTSNQVELLKILKKFMIIVMNASKKKFVSFKIDAVKWASLEEVLEIIRENPNWRIPTISELIELGKLKSEEIELRSEYWAINENNSCVIYSIESGKVTDMASYNESNAAYLNYDGGDWSTIIPFTKLGSGIQLVRNLTL